MELTICLLASLHIFDQPSQRPCYQYWNTNSMAPIAMDFAYRTGNGMDGSKAIGIVVLSRAFTCTHVHETYVIWCTRTTNRYVYPVTGGAKLGKLVRLVCVNRVWWFPISVLPRYSIDCLYLVVLIALAQSYPRNCWHLCFGADFVQNAGKQWIDQIVPCYFSTKDRGAKHGAYRSQQVARQQQQF